MGTVTPFLCILVQVDIDYTHSNPTLQQNALFCSSFTDMSLEFYFINVGFQLAAFGQLYCVPAYRRWLGVEGRRLVEPLQGRHKRFRHLHCTLSNPIHVKSSERFKCSDL